jgi:hypothetical protein
MNLRATTAATAYIATIPTANLLVTHFGAVPVGFGLMAPAGVFMVGLALVLRDLVHEAAGRWAVLAAIVVGAGLSYLLASPALATASAAAFGVAELADMAVYEPIRTHGLKKSLLLLAARFSGRASKALKQQLPQPHSGRVLAAVLVSNAVGLVVDSWLFLHLAFGNLAFLPGQIVAKTEMTLLAVVVLWAIARYRRPVTA